MSLNPDDAMTIHGWEPARQTCLCSLGGRGGTFSPWSVTVTQANRECHSLHTCYKWHRAFSKCVMLVFPLIKVMFNFIEHP